MTDGTTPLPISFSVAAWIPDGQESYLLLRRSPSCRHFAGLWEPPGGKVEGGENLVSALVREVREETSLDVVVVDMAGVTRFDLPGVRVVMLAFTVALTGGAFALGNEHDAFRRVSRDEIAALDLTPQARKLLESWRG